MSTNAPKKINQAKFDAARAAVLRTRAAHENMRSILDLKYGSGHQASWRTTAENKRLDQLANAHGRAMDRMITLLENSPRDWRRGAPVFWVTGELSYDDAVRPTNEPLSVVPPIAYGYSHPIA